MEEQTYKWAGIPFKHRYSSIRADENLVRSLMKYDCQLDLKFYLPKEKWHLVRHLSLDRFGKFTRVWELDDRPDIGLRKDPGMWLLDALKAGDMRGHAENRVEEVDKLNAAVDASNDRELEAQCKDVASDMRKPLQRLYDFGPDADHKGVF